LGSDLFMVVTCLTWKYKVCVVFYWRPLGFPP
jgi:hypothetical protein